MIRILFFTGTLRIAGAEQYLVQLVGRLDRRRFEPVVACFDDQGPLRTELLEAKIPIVRFRVEGNLYRARSLASFARAVPWIRRGRFDLVQSWTNYPNVFGGLAALAAGSRLLCALRGVFPSGTIFFDPNPTLERVHHWVARRAFGMVVNSRGLRDYVRDIEGVPTDRILVIPNGVDEDRFARRRAIREEARREIGLGDGDFAVSYVGRLTRGKGSYEVLESFRRAGLPRSRLFLAGEGAAEEDLRREAREGGVTDRVHFLGVRRDVARILNATDVFLFLSHREGCPSALLEAMAAECAIVASRAAGIDEVVGDGNEALLVPVGDVAASADAIRRLHADEELRRHLSASARRRALRFSLSGSIRQFEDAYAAAAR